MTKTSEKSGTTATSLKLIVCLSALSLLYGITGCSTDETLVQSGSGSSKEYASMVGPPGADGPAGPAGAKGAVGATGSPGAGVAGAAGDTGARGATTVGVAEAAGTSGEPGPQGVVGSTGAQGPAGVISRWTSYRDFRFDSNEADLRPSETNKVSEIALYLKTNPSLKVGLDGTMEPRNQRLSDRRVSTIHGALTKAGVPTSRIHTNSFAFDESKPSQDGRVAVLIRTAE